MHYLTIIVSSLLGPIGLDWKELKATLNPTFEWQKAVQAALGTDDSLESVWIVLILWDKKRIDNNNNNINNNNNNNNNNKIS